MDMLHSLLKTQLAIYKKIIFSFLISIIYHIPFLKFIFIIIVRPLQHLIASNNLSLQSMIKNTLRLDQRYSFIKVILPFTKDIFNIFNVIILFNAVILNTSKSLIYRNVLLKQLFPESVCNTPNQNETAKIYPIVSP